MKYFLLFLLLITVISSSFSQDSTRKEASSNFRKWLLEKSEYEAYIYSLKKSIKADTNDEQLKLELILFFEQQQSWDSSLYYLNFYFSNQILNNKNLLLQDLHLLIINSKNKELNKEISKQSLLDTKELIAFRLSGLLLEKKWKQSIQYYDSIKSLYGESSHFEKMIQEIRIPHKSPLLAMSLSTLVPGLGKVYAGRWRDGIISFVMIGMLTTQSYIGFHKKGTSSVFGWINGGLAAGFYLGNIYGSYKAAKWYNKRKDEKIYHHLMDHHKGFFIR